MIIDGLLSTSDLHPTESPGEAGSRTVGLSFAALRYT